MHFVDDVDLVAGVDGSVAHPVEQLAHLVDLGARGGVELQHVHMPALDDGAAVTSLHAQLDGRLMPLGGLEVEGARQEPGGGGLANPPHPGEHEGVGDAAGGEGVAQRAHHRLLADHVLEALRTVLARQDDIAVVADRRRRRGLAKKHLRRVGVALFSVGFERQIGFGHRLSGNRVETGRRPEAKLVTAASFRT